MDAYTYVFLHLHANSGTHAQAQKNTRRQESVKCYQEYAGFLDVVVGITIS